MKKGLSIATFLFVAIIASASLSSTGLMGASISSHPVVLIVAHTDALFFDSLTLSLSDDRNGLRPDCGNFQHKSGRT